VTRLRQRRDFAPPVTFPRDEFLAERWNYQAGDHVTFLAPTQNGKTTLAFELLDRTASKELPAIVLVQKPRDPVVKKWLDYLRDDRGWIKTENWPPNPLRKRAAGYIVWPRYTYHPDTDNRKQEDIFRRAILDSYKQGNRILFADETYGLTNRLDLDKELISVWSQGAGMGCGLWAATQRPAYIPLWAYSQAEHVFISADPDKRARMRYAEIGGINPHLVEATVQRLPKYHWLYIRRTGPAVCIVGDSRKGSRT
jgi:hypothetical protein